MAPKGATAPGDGRGAAAAIVRPRSFKEGDPIEALDIQQLWYPARIVKSTAAQVRHLLCDSRVRIRAQHHPPSSDDQPAPDAAH